MADNIDVTPGVGKTVAADEIAGALHQRVKITVGADGTNDGDVSSANPLPINDAGGSITVDGTVAVTDLATLATSANQLPDGHNVTVDNEAGAAAVNVQDGGNSLTVDGTVTANLSATDNAVLDQIELNQDAQTALLTAMDADTSSIATDASTIAGDTTSIDGKITACNTGAVTVAASALPTGASTETTLAALNTKVTACNTGAVVLAAGSAAIGKLAANSGVDIGDVDVTSCALPTGAATSAKQDTLIGHVDGIETVLGTIDADTGAIKTAVETIDNAIDGTEMQVDVVAPLPAGTNAIGKLAANSGVDIGDVDVLSLPALPAGTNSIGQIQPSKYPTTDDAEYMNKYYTSAGAATDGIIWSPAAGKRWYVTDLIINVSADATVTLEDDLTAGDNPILKCELKAGGGFCKRFNTPLASGEDAADLLITTSAGNVYVTACGYEV